MTGSLLTRLEGSQPQAQRLGIPQVSSPISSLPFYLSASLLHCSCCCCFFRWTEGPSLTHTKDSLLLPWIRSHVDVWGIWTLDIRICHQLVNLGRIWWRRITWLRKLLPFPARTSRCEVNSRLSCMVPVNSLCFLFLQTLITKSSIFVLGSIAYWSRHPEEVLSCLSVSKNHVCPSCAPGTILDTGNTLGGWTNPVWLPQP